MQLKLKITPDCYAEIHNLSIDSRNKGKEYVEVIVMSESPIAFMQMVRSWFLLRAATIHSSLKMRDHTSLIAFLGQVRHRLVTFLKDRHERIVPGILEWELTQCDINKDIKVGEGLQYTGLKVQCNFNMR